MKIEIKINIGKKDKTPIISADNPVVVVNNGRESWWSESTHEWLSTVDQLRRDSQERGNQPEPKFGNGYS